MNDQSLRKIQEDMRTLKRFLQQGMDDAHAKGAKVKLDDQARILNMACGRADETQVVSELFLNQQTEAEIIGVDLRHREIEMAQNHWKDQLPDHIKTQFLNFDATKLNEHQSLQDKNDLALFRHQNFWNGPKIWRSIFENTIDTIKDDGLVVITSYFDKEHELAVRELSDQGLELVTNLRNNNSRLVHAKSDKSVDRHLAIFRKN